MASGLAGKRRVLACALSFACLVLLIDGAPVRAATTVVDCGAVSDDITALQHAVDQASSGTTIEIQGMCNFSKALPHGGTKTTIDSAAVVLGSSQPAHDLIIEGQGQTAVIGTGTQAAFYIPPGASNITIRGLVFSNFGRAVVINDASNITIGALGTQTPDPLGNSVSGDAGMSSAILASAVEGTSLHVSYGNAGSHSATYALPAQPTLTGVVIAGNKISYQTLGAPTSNTSLVAFDVRQAGAAVASGITIQRNAAWFATNEFRSFEMDSIRVEGSGAPSPKIDGVTIADNSIGRPEEIGQSAPATSAGGRAGIVVRRVAHAHVSGNAVRARVGATAGYDPGGGIVLDSTTDALVTSNQISTLVDSQAGPEDLGAIAIVKNLDVVLGEQQAQAVSTHATVTSNTIGSAAAPAGRGMLVAGTDWGTLSNNTVVASSAAALSVGVVVGPNAGPSLPTATSKDVLCGNSLDGAMDNPNQVQRGAVRNSNLPGGSLVSTNGECVAPNIAFIEQAGGTKAFENGAPGTFTVALSHLPSDVVTLAIATTTPSQAFAAPSSVSFTPDNWSAPQTITVNAPEDHISQGTQLQTVVHTASSTDPAYNGMHRSVLAQIVDADPGSVIVSEHSGGTKVVEGGASDSYTIALATRPAADVNIYVRPSAQLAVSTGVLTFHQANWWIPQTVTVSAPADGVRQQAHYLPISHQASSSDPNFDRIVVAQVLVYLIDTDLPPAPAISVPRPNGLVRSASLIIVGTGEALDTLHLSDGSNPIGTAAISSDGNWSIGPLSFVQGTHTLTATVVDANGFTSPALTQSFTVNLSPPSAPAITQPLEGASLNDAHVTVSGTADPNTVVSLTEGSLSWAAPVGAGGSWSTTILFPMGNHSITATDFDGAGNAGPPSTARSFFVAVNGIPPDPPTVVSPEPGEVVGPTFTISGFTQPFDQVGIWFSGQILALVQADANGLYRATMNNIDSGDVSLRVRAQDQSLNYSMFSAVVRFKVDGTPPTAFIVRPPNQRYVSVYGPSDPGVAGSAWDDDVVVGVHLIYFNRAGSETVQHDATLCCNDGAGGVSWVDSTPLDPGVWHVAAVAYDRAGNESPPSETDLVKL